MLRHRIRPAASGFSTILVVSVSIAQAKANPRPGNGMKSITLKVREGGEDSSPPSSMDTFWTCPNWVKNIRRIFGLCTFFIGHNNKDHCVLATKRPNILAELTAADPPVAGLHKTARYFRMATLLSHLLRLSPRPVRILLAMEPLVLRDIDGVRCKVFAAPWHYRGWW